MIHQSLKKAADSRHCDIEFVISPSLIKVAQGLSCLTHTNTGTRVRGGSKQFRLKGGVPPSKIFIASSFKSIQLFEGAQASTVRN